MAKRKLILYLKELPSCTCYGRIFNTEYETAIAYTEAEFFANIHNVPADAAVVCFCSAREEDVENVLRLDVLTGPLPVLTCSKTLNPNFVRKAAQRGAARFLVCNIVLHWKNYHDREDFFTTKTQSAQRKNNLIFFVAFVPLWLGLVAAKAALRE